jgi:uracil-DNA glycosylase
VRVAALTDYVEQTGRSENLAGVREIVGECTRCSLSRGRKSIVFGDGNGSADLLFVGEAPGRAEDEQGLPFVGPAGRLLDELLERIGLRREDVYITNVVKCRPPGNRDPMSNEIEACNPFLKAQLRLIKPKVVCMLGRVASGVLLGRNVQMNKLHGQRLEGPGCFMVPVFHPAAVLRTPSTRGKIEDDFDNLNRYLHDDRSPPEPPAEEPEQMGLF